MCLQSEIFSYIFVLFIFLEEQPAQKKKTTTTTKDVKKSSSKSAAVSEEEKKKEISDSITKKGLKIFFDYVYRLFFLFVFFLFFFFVFFMYTKLSIPILSIVDKIFGLDGLFFITVNLQKVMYMFALFDTSEFSKNRSIPKTCRNSKTVETDGA